MLRMLTSIMPGYLWLHASHRSGMRKISAYLLLLLLVQVISWLMPVPESLRGIANYLPLHTLFETISIVISMLVFAVAWNSQSNNQSGNIILLACVFFAVGWLDFSHTLSYTGMPDFVTPSHPEKGLAFGLVGRFLASFALLALTVRVWKPFNSDKTRYVLMSAGVAIVIFVNWLVLYHQDALPHTWIPGKGLTPLKIQLEYGFIAMNLATAIILLAKMRTEQPFNAALLLGAVCVMAMSAFFFTMYAALTDIFNMLGHIYKVIAYLFIYRAMIAENIEKPYRELEESRSKVALAIHASNTALWDWNLNSNEVYFSPEWALQLGYKPQELAPAFSTWADLLHPDDKEKAHENVRNFLASSDKYYENEFRMRHRDGSYRWIMARGEKQFDKQGKPDHLIGAHIDITERKEAEEQLRRLSLVVEQSQEIIVITDIEALIIYVNDTFQRITGFSRDEVLGKNPGFLKSGKTPPETYAAMWAALSKGETWAGELFNRKKDGSKYVEHAIITPLRQPDGTISNYVAVKEDITEKKRMGEELDQHRHHLETLVEQRTRELDAALKVAENANQAKSEFLANMSHELRTPMNAILGMLYLAQRHNLPTTLRSNLTKAQGAANSLLTIINDILDLSKIEAGKLQIESISFALDSVLEKLSDSIGFQADEKNIKFLMNYDPALPSTLIGDPLRIGQVLLNLCGNALKFTERGEIEISFNMLSRTEDELTLQVCVRDTGIGIPPERQEKLFQKFSQADQSTTRRFGGTGLGLAISRNLIELMGGRIWLEKSELQRGSEFRFTLPLKIVDEANVHQEELKGQVGTMLEGVRVLVVDDNHASREILSETLSLFRLEVTTVESGRAALGALEEAAARREPFDLVLIDWRMPGMNGDEATWMIRRNATISPMPKIIMISAHGREDIIRQAEAAGVDGFLSKPILHSTLLDTVMSTLGRGRLLSKTSMREEASQLWGKEKLDPSGLRLLLVEDNEINRDFAKELLLSTGLEIVEAVNGQEAVNKVTQQQFDIVLMDIQMPVLDGLDATRQIRALAKTSGHEHLNTLPIIAMTALAMTTDAERCLEAGMNDYVSKPIEPERLIAVLAKWAPPPAQRAGKKIPASSSRTQQVTEDVVAALMALESVDARQGIQRIGGNSSAYLKQLLRFREHFSDAASQLRQLTREGKLQQAEAYCHTLKGVVGNLGAHSIHALTTSIDNILKQEQIPDDAAIKELEIKLQAMLAEIDRLSNNLPKPAQQNAEKIDIPQLDKVLQKLAHALEKDLGRVEPLLTELSDKTTGSDLEPQIADLAALIDTFCIDEALQSLRKLQTHINHLN